MACIKETGISEGKKKKNIYRMENNLENIEVVRTELIEVSYTSMETLVL